MKQRILVRICLFRWGVRKFERDLNALLDQGWTLCPNWSMSVESFGFLKMRVKCEARLEKKS